MRGLDRPCRLSNVPQIMRAHTQREITLRPTAALTEPRYPFLLVALVPLAVRPTAHPEQLTYLAHRHP